VKDRGVRDEWEGSAGDAHVIDASASSKYRIVLCEDFCSFLGSNASTAADTGALVGALDGTAAASEETNLDRKSPPLLLLKPLLLLLLLRLLVLLDSDETFLPPDPAAAAAKPMYRAREPSTLLLLLLTGLTPSLHFTGGGEFDESNLTHSIQKAIKKIRVERALLMRK
jgi:hypothetical protein